ncbi:MAG: peptidoglycan DD-metalloendopeptidase family protein [Oscillospiraceae bacterium]|nr:peptidoglycan DD-metalloendopeptidase family protein [Oscillospiraceae bacterium]MDY6208728.1 peptidoglycan DD-metalloendopeptidase family protein [Oscillospiraceae bacterium]
MEEKRNNKASLIECVGEQVCRTAGLTAEYAAHILNSAVSAVKHSSAPFGQDVSAFLRELVKIPVTFIKTKKENVSEVCSRFKRRSKIFGVRKAAAMQWKEHRLAVRRKGSAFASVMDILFPTASVCLLVFCVNTVMSRDYGVAVEYDGAQVGVVSGEEVLGEAQCVVADRVKYYDIEGDYYVTAALAITPLTSNDSVIDEAALAENMEGRISEKYDEKPASIGEEVPAEEVPEFDNGKIKAYAVRVDGEFIGAVESYDQIENVLDTIKAPYDSGEYEEICFDKDVEYDLEEYVDENQIVSESSILQTLTGVESAPEYYEVQPGDNLWNIAESKGMTLDELSSCYATYNGQVVEDLEHQVLRVGTLIQIESEVPYLQVECKKEVTFRKDIPYESITIEDSSLPTGQVVIDTEGHNGEQRSRALVTYREGTAVRKRTLETVIVNEPVSEIIRVGTGTGEDVINYSAPEFITEGGSGDYFWPVDGGYISAHQGDGRGHKGIDIAAPYGTPIYAAASGTVIDAGTGWNGGYGNCIIIQNDDGNVTVYAHQAELVAEYGDIIEKGQLIGYVGSTGDSSGNHLHFEVRKDGKYYDPELYVSQ